MLNKGETVCGYEVIGPIGGGGLGNSYKARAADGRLVTLKLPMPALLGDPAIYERFLREFKIGKELAHPAIPHAIAMEETPNGPCLVLEYADGESLRSYLHHYAPLPVEETLSIVGQLASALDYLHNHGVFHRDMKPENVIISADGKIHIVDFGIALLEGARRVTWAALSDVMGTPDYMAPEQIQGKRGDVRTDVYALGIMLYEMLTGIVPFRGDNALAVMSQHLTAEPTPPRKITPSIPPSVESIALKAIRRNPDERYQSAQSFLYDIEHHKELDVSQFSLGPQRKMRGVVTNRQVWMLAVGIGIGFLVVVAAILVIVFLLKS